MAGRSRGAAQEPKDLCCYVAETSETGVKEEVIQLISKCIQDKIFSSSPDYVCLVRDDNMVDVSFTTVDWNFMRNAESNFRQERKPNSEYKLDPVSVLSAVCDSMEIQSMEDKYRHRKILFFGSFNGHLNRKKIQDLAIQLENGNISTTIVVPDKMDQTEIQKENVNVLSDIFEQLPGTSSVITMKDATWRLMNLATKKPVRPNPWQCDLEIGMNLKIPASFFVCTRKNENKYLQQALLKQVEKLPGSKPIKAGERPVAELKSKVTQKEEIWTQNDGAVIDPSDIVDGYYYGDKLIPFDAIQQSNQYSTGDKCAKVLLFCPKDNIKPFHLVGNGNDVVFPQKNNPSAEIKFVALVQAMHNTNRVAIIRKVRTTNAKMVIGVLSPYVNRKCLIYSELCFADDVSIPYFAPLIRETTSPELSVKELVIDELIKCKSIGEFDPTQGPVDPGVCQMRENIANKFIGSIGSQNQIALLSTKIKDGIDLYFDHMHEVDDRIVKSLKEAYPLKEVIQKGSDRPSGQQIFRKRIRDTEAIEDVSNGGDKKIKSDEDISEQNPDIQAEMDAAADMFDPDNLIDIRKSVSNGPNLYALDFDHTIIRDNSDTFVSSAIQSPLSEDIETFYDGTNWTAYMNKLMQFMASKGATVEIIQKRIQELEFLPGMAELLGIISQNNIENPGSKLVIVSDANDYFIKTVLNKLKPPIIPDLIITNFAQLPNSDTKGVISDDGGEIPYLKILPYENQSICPICPKNLCKGAALDKYIETNGPFNKVYYCGDGRNDVCPGLRLGENDVLFVRKGFPLEKCIANGTVIRGMADKLPVNIRAKIIYFENGFQIHGEMFNSI